MKHKRKGGIFILIAIILLLALGAFMWDRVLTDPLLIGLVFVVVICACINIFIGLILMFGNNI